MRRLIAILCIAFAIVALIAPVAFIEIALLLDSPHQNAASQSVREIVQSRDSGFGLTVLTSCRHLARSTVPAA
jgi:hypothetical protein